MSPSCPFCFKPMERVDNSTNLVNYSWKCEPCEAWVAKAKPKTTTQEYWGLTPANRIKVGT